jgi:hypothetical protein
MPPTITAEQAKGFGLYVLYALIPGFPKIKEWAYAGFTFAWTCAFIGHYPAGDGPKAFMPLVFLIILFISYFTETTSHRRAGIDVA